MRPNIQIQLADQLLQRQHIAPNIDCLIDNISGYRVYGATTQIDHVQAVYVGMLADYNGHSFGIDSSPSPETLDNSERLLLAELLDGPDDTLADWSEPVTARQDASRSLASMIEQLRMINV